MLQQPLLGEGKCYRPARPHGAAHHFTAVRVNPRRKIHRQYWNSACIDGLDYPRRQPFHRPVQSHAKESINNKSGTGHISPELLQCPTVQYMLDHKAAMPQKFVVNGGIAAAGAGCGGHPERDGHSRLLQQPRYHQAVSAIISRACRHHYPGRERLKG